MVISTADAETVLRDKRARRSLARYFSVVQNQKLAKFLIARKIPADFNHSDPAERLWQEHSSLTQEFSRIEKEIDEGQKDFKKMPVPSKSYVDLKIEIANRILSSCHLCNRRCSINRLTGATGYCKCGSTMMVSTIFEHMGEEPELVPSGTIFTMGCTMRCKHCQNWTISQWVEGGEPFEPEELADKVEQLRTQGCRNVNLVGGEPTPWLPQWLTVFKHVNANVPIVWNSNSYYSRETALLLAGFTDVYLLDFKYGPGECAQRISDASNYWEVCTRNHLEAEKSGELIIRMLVLPNHLECCVKPTTAWIAKNLGTETRVNIMFQYRPEWLAHEIPELSRRLTVDETERAIESAREANLTNFIT